MIVDVLDAFFNRIFFFTDHPRISTAILAFNLFFGIPSALFQRGQWALPFLIVLAIVSIWLFKLASDRSRAIVDKSALKHDYYLGHIDVPFWLKAAQGLVLLYLTVFVILSLWMDALALYGFLSGSAAPR